MLAAAPCAAAQQSAPAVVQGRVTDADGAAVPYASVLLVGTTAGTATDTTGHFRFATRHRGRGTLRISAVGYTPATRHVVLVPGDTLTLLLRLHEAVTEREEAVVTARAEPPVLDDASEMRPLEAVTTAGASGGLFRALKMLPGAQAAGDGAALFVRGGARHETKVFLDGAPVAHPYRQESPAGTAFGTIPPFLTSGAHFAAGGFSARYGNALSGVLVMETQGQPRQHAATLGLGLAAASVQAAAPVAGETLGLRLSGNRSFTGVLFRVNGLADDFHTLPRSADGSGALHYRYGDSGRLKAFGFVQHSRLAVHAKEPSFAGVFAVDEQSQLYFLDWQHDAGPWHLSANLSHRRHAETQQFGVLDLTGADRGTQFRLDTQRPLRANSTLSAGALLEHRTSTLTGTVPTGYAPAPAAPTRTLDERLPARRAGAYAEVDVSLLSGLSLRAGLRADHHSLARQTVLAPRLRLRYHLSAYTTARLAWGLYHQFPALSRLDAPGELPALQAERAQHFIAGLEHERGNLQARLEAYYKPYDHLVVERPSEELANAGDGVAYGLDTFARYGAFLETRFSGWVAYSLLHSRRTQMRRLGERHILEKGPTPQSITHSLALVGKTRIVGGLYGGGTFRWASGAPVTPVVGAVPAGPGEGFLPIEGAVGSERQPPFRRLDLQLSYYWPLGDGRAATFYVSVANALGHRNVVGYDYTPNYAERTPQHSPYRRLFYAGLTLGL